MALTGSAYAQRGGHGGSHGGGGGSHGGGGGFHGGGGGGFHGAVASVAVQPAFHGGS